MRLNTPNTDDIEISERYDKESDVYYVTVRTGEPSMSVEYDDRFLLEVGIFTGLPTGFRILNYSKYKVVTQAFCHIFKKMCVDAGLRKTKAAGKARETLQREIGKALETAAV